MTADEVRVDQTAALRLIELQAECAALRLERIEQGGLG